MNHSIRNASMEVVSTSRLLDSLGSKEEWQRQSGYSIENAGIGVLKEGLDNALDACEETASRPSFTSPWTRPDSRSKTTVP
ncbi:MAG: hypothetical protein ABSG53_09020, partial [Thermoguttaceae bacterium]